MNENLTYYEEAMRYVENARATLKNAGKEDKYYKDLKYVKSAAGIAYAGVEQAAKWFLKLHGNTSVGSYKLLTEGLSEINKSVNKLLESCNTSLHKNIYYRNESNIKIVDTAIDTAEDFMDCLKIYDKQFVYRKGGKVKPATHNKK